MIRIRGLPASPYWRQMRHIDLSHAIHDGMITYPGLPAPEIGEFLSRDASRPNYSPGTEFSIGRISMVGNTGTYLDTPFHRYADGWDLADLPLERVAGVPGIVVHATDLGIGVEGFEGLDMRGRAVLIRTDWSTHWGTDRYLDATHPHLTAAAVEALVRAAPALVGIDSVNIDDTRGGERPAHSGLLAADIPIVEHLTGLDRLPEDGFEFYAIPAPIAGLGTLPVRAFAIIR